MGHVTMRDVARAAGVSVSAVSLALKGSRKVSAGTAARIQEVVSQLGYQPDASLNRLAALRWDKRRRARARLGAILNRPDSLKTERNTRVILDGMRSEAGVLGYDVEVAFVGEFETNAQMRRVLFNRGVAGIAVLSERWRGEGFDWTAFAGVTTSSFRETPRLHQIASAVGESVLEVMERVRIAGFDRIGAVLLNDADGHDNLEKIGAVLFDQAHHVADPAERIAPLLLDPLRAVDRGWQDPLERWLAEWRPAAVIGFTDTVYWWLRELGYRFPGPVGYASLVHSDDPQVAGMRFPAFEYGVSAVRVLDRQLRAGERGLQERRIRTQVEMEWREGASLRRWRGGGEA